LAKTVSVALVGPWGIGRIHTREFVHAGAHIAGVLASTQENTRIAAAALEAQYGGPVRAHDSLADLVESEVDAVSVCSPPRCHLEAVRPALAAGKYVLCEKPLFWRDGLTPAEAAATCDDLARAADGRLVVNTCNSLLAEAWYARHGRPAAPSTFDFHFHTNGPFRGEEIGIDLLPHACSVLLTAIPDGTVEQPERTLSERCVEYRFRFGGAACRFDLREDPAGARAFGFRLDNTAVERIQDEVDGRYRVRLVPAGRPAEAFEVPDPFRVAIGRFVGGVTARDRFDVAMATATRIMTMTTEIAGAPREKA
jgi:hypothetical protein